jgi:DNA-binding beta-propeller fold protein YncE
MHTPPGFIRRFAGIFLSAVIAAPIVISTVASAPAQAAGTPLFPNLKTLPARELRFDRADISAELSGNFHNVLRFSNDTYNAGDGPLIVNGKINLSTLRGPSSQRVMNSDGTYTDYNLNNEMYWHEAHHHYHFDNWGDYQLWSKSTYDSYVASGRTSGSPLYSGAKTTSCITDEEYITSVPASVYPGPYGLGGCQTDGQGNIRMGLSVGWGDTYDWYRQLQWIDLGPSGALGNGTYVLRSVADPLNFVYESTNKSDSARESVDDNEATTTFIVNNGSILDSDAPTGTVAINHVDASTNNAAVSVDVIGRDDVSTVSQFRLSNDGVTYKTFSYQSSGSAPTTVAWNLTDAAYGGNTSNGVKTVYAQAKDNSGKWGPVFTDTINYGSGGPPPPPPPPPPNGPYPEAVMGDNPGGYWRLNETSGISAGDTFGSNPGTYKNGVTLNRPSLLVSDPDKAASFASATKQYVSIPSSGPIAPAAQVTTEAWIKPTTVPTGFASIISKPESYSLQFNGGKLEFTIIQAGVRKRLQAPAGAIVANTTYYVVGTYDGTTQRLYINGTQVASAALTGGITTNVSALNIGSWDGAIEFYNGVIDEAAVYPLALSASQIAVHRADGINAGGTQAQLSISRSGTGGGNVTSVPAGVDCGTTCSHQFAAGTSVTLTAAATSGSTFGGWSGGGCSGTGTCTITLSSNTSVNAAFNSTNPTLTVAKSGTGSGVVTSSPAGVDCGTTCSAQFSAGTPVTLTATADSGSSSTFTGWSGGGCSGTGTCNVTLNANTTVTAGFSAPVPNPTLTVAKSGTGTGGVTSSPAGIDCGATCSTSYATGTPVTLTATADSGSTFTGWSGGGCSGTGTCNVTLNANTTVTAGFSLPVPNPTLTVAKSGTGTGGVTSSPAGINCGATCSAQYAPGTPVTLTATADSGSTFTGWSGACSGTGACSFTLNASTTVTAAFSPTSSGTYAQAVTGDSPAGYWKLNETSGTSAVDSTGTSNGVYKGTTLNQPGLLAASSNKAATFSGSNSAVTIPSKTALSPSAKVTAEAWIKPTTLPASGAFASIVTKAETYSLQFNGPRLEFTIIQSGTRRRLQAPVGAIAVNGKYHIVGTYDGATQRLYINGVSVASAALTGAITVNTTALTLAAWAGTSEYYKGTIDEAAVYGTALTNTQVANHYNAGTTSLVALVQKPASAQLVALSKLAASRHGAVGGTTPVAVVYDNALHRAYVSHNVGTGRAASSAVTVFDTRSWKAIAEIVTSPTPVSSSIAVDPVTHLVYVTAAVYEPFHVGGSVKVIDGRTAKLVDSIPTGPGPKAIAVNPSTHRVYVTAQTGRDSDLAITVINGTTGRLITTIPIGPYGEYYDNPFGLAVNAKTNKVYASNPLDGFVYTLNGATNAIEQTAPIGAEPTAIAVNPVTNKVFVAGARDVTMLDGRSGRVKNRIVGGVRTRGIAVDSGRNKIYATADGGGLLVIDGRTLKAGHLITHGRKPNGIAIDRSGTIVVANGFNANVSVYTDERAVGTS